MWIAWTERADFIQKYFKVDWPDRAIYQTTLNTAIGDETCGNYDFESAPKLSSEGHYVTTVQKLRCEI